MKSLYLMIGIITAGPGHEPVPPMVWPEVYSDTGCFNTVALPGNREAYNRIAEKIAGPGATMKVICAGFPRDKTGEFVQSMIGAERGSRDLEKKLKELGLPPDWQPEKPR